MDKGGEWQEEMDIKFAFIKGIPPRQVLSVQQIWPADAYGFTSILSNQQLEPRTITYKPEVKSMKIRTVATGHGQEGEFIPRTHSLLVNNTNFHGNYGKNVQTTRFILKEVHGFMTEQGGVQVRPVISENLKL